MVCAPEIIFAPHGLDDVPLRQRHAAKRAAFLNVTYWDAQFLNCLSCSNLKITELAYKPINDSLTFFAYAEVLEATPTSRAHLRYEMRHNGPKGARNTRCATHEIFN